MSYKDKEIAKASYYEVPETCPHVDAALEAAADAIKSQTSALRDALNDYIGKWLEEQERVSDLEKELSDAQSEIESLKHELSEYR